MAAAGTGATQQEVMQQMESAHPSYATIRQTQALVLREVAEQRIGLAPAARPALSPDGLLQLEAPDGSAAAVVRALAGPGVRWLSASQLSNPGKGFGGTIVTGFSAADSDVPHYLLEQSLFGGEVLLVVALWPRRDWMVEDAYLQQYYGSAPPGCERSYNELYNATLQYAGWRRYQSPELVVKPMLSTAMAFSFPPTEENLLLARQTALEAAHLWASFLEQAKGDDSGSQAGHDGAVRKYDLRYVESVKEDPGNAFAAIMFGQEATHRLVATMHGWEEGNG